MKLTFIFIFIILFSYTSNAKISHILGGGVAGYAIGKIIDNKQEHLQKKQIAYENDIHNREIAESEELAKCLKKYKKLHKKDLNFNGSVSEKLGFCRGSI